MIAAQACVLLSLLCCACAMFERLPVLLRLLVAALGMGLAGTALALWGVGAG